MRLLPAWSRVQRRHSQHTDLKPVLVGKFSNFNKVLKEMKVDLDSS